MFFNLKVCLATCFQETDTELKPKNYYQQFRMISRHGTKKLLLSMEFEILGLEVTNNSMQENTEDVTY